jgi:protein phosphatase
LVAETVAEAAPTAAAWADPERELPALLAQANARVLERARGPLSGMGATAVLLFLQGKRGWVCHAGDSRAYRWRAGVLAQLTVDHTPENELGLDAHGRHLDLPEVRRASPPRRRSGMITRAVGIGPDLESDTRAIDLRPGDRFVLCSDGLTDLVSPARMADLLGASAAPAGACRALVEAALAAGGLDNVTVVVIDSA